MRYVSKLIRGSLDKDRIYDEWIIGCRVVPLAARSAEDYITQIYYLSRGDLKNTVFGYTNRFNDSKLYVDSYFHTVSVVARVDKDFDVEYEEIDSETASEESFNSARSSMSRSSSTRF